jgi:hypothetical protein
MGKSDFVVGEYGQWVVYSPAPVVTLAHSQAVYNNGALPTAENSRQKNR